MSERTTTELTLTIDADDTEVEQYLRSLFPELEDAGQGQGGVSEERVKELIAEAEVGTGGVGEERLAAIDAAIEDLRETVDAFERKSGLRGVTWKAGPPSIPSDALMHSTPLWGPYFSTQYSLTLGDVTMQSLKPGVATIRAYEWSGSNGTLGRVLGEKEVRFTGNVQSVHLDIDIPAGKRVLLTRPYHTGKAAAPSAYQVLPDQAFKGSDDEVSLAMVPYDPRTRDSKNGVKFLGKGHPLFTGNSTQYWHYFYGLEMTADVPTDSGG